MTNKKDEHCWQAEEYHQHSQIQHDAANDLLKCIDLSRFQRVLDIGCGDGKITAQIAGKLKIGGSVLGIDLSPEMIAFASKKYSSGYGLISFHIQDAREIEFKNEFDLVFSSFAIQWVIDQKSLFFKIYNALLKDGCFAATIPLGISDSLDQAIHDTISSKEWNQYFENFIKTWNFYTSEEIKQAIDGTQFQIVKFDVVFQEVWFESISKFAHYVLQWLPYLKPLPAEFREKFFQEILKRYIALEPPRKDGSVRFGFPRVDIIAYKISP